MKPGGGLQNPGDLRGTELVFLGTSGAIQVPAFFCSCDTCGAARRDPAQRRTRASVALVGNETTLIDAGPDLEFQLVREGLRQIDRVFITHWHYDHVWGLGALGEPSSIARWPRIDVYLPHQVAYHFDHELAYTRHRVDLHPISGAVQLIEEITPSVVHGALLSRTASR